MAKALRVIIGGKEYPLRGDDEDVVVSAAKMVDEQIGLLSSRFPDKPDLTHAVLAALNLAEETIKLQKLLEKESVKIAEEINKMTNLVNQTSELE